MRRPMSLRLTAISLVAMVAFSPFAHAKQSPANYDRVVAPLLAKYCAGCHNDDDREGDFSLETYKALRLGTTDGPALLPGDSASSRIVRLMTGAASPKMPPKGHPRPTDAEVAKIKEWIDAGAAGPKNEAPDPLALIVPAFETKTKVRPVTALDVSPDGSWLAVGRYGEVALHRIGPDGASGTPVKVLTPLPGKVTAAHFTRDGKRLVTASGVAGLGGLAAIWDLEGGTIVRSFQGHRDLLHDAELSPDERMLATCGYENRIQLWNTETGELVRRLEGHNGAIYDVAFSPDGAFLVSGSADDTCKVWRLADGTRMDTLAQPLKEVYGCFFTPDGRSILAVGADNNVRVWKFISRERPDINPMVTARFAHEAPILRAALTRDGSKLITIGADRVVKVWDTADYSELQSWKDQPDVAMALAVAPDGSSCFVGRMDGSLARLVIAGRTEVKPAVDAALPVVAAPSAEMKAIAEVEPNNTPEQANPIALPAKITGKVQGKDGEQADADFFRFHARAGEDWVFEVDAARSKSKLDSFLEVLDARGGRVERVLLQAVRDAYFTFRGKDSVQVDDFRLFNWEEMNLNEYLYANGEVVKLWLYPRGPDSGFIVYPGQGKRWGWFDTTPLAQALGGPCYIVEAHPPGTELRPNGLPVIPLFFENDDEAHQTLGRDSRLFFRAPADGEYLVKIKDVRGQEGADFTYTLIARPLRPDFQASIATKALTLAAGDAREYVVKVERADGFEGAVRVEITGLPPGFFSAPVEVEAGQIEAQGVVWTTGDTKKPTAEQARAIKVRAVARIDGREVGHDVNELVEVQWNEKTPTRVTIAPSASGAQPQRTPAEGPLEFAIRPGETIQLEVRIERNGANGPIGFGTLNVGRNLPFGCYVDNIGLNGLLVVEGQDAREFFITADKSVPPQVRLFHLKTDVGGGTASRPVLLHVRP